jgi:formylglycine-generating enzyme required for sulfatase activity
VAEFFIARFPVTFEEYCLFLDDRLGGAAPPAEERRAALVPSFGREEYVVREPGGSFTPVEKLHRRFPVMGIQHEAMLEYCEWLGRRLGKKVRLPEETEW